MQGHLRQRGKNGTWYVVFRVNGKPKWQRLEAKAQREAEKEATKILNELNQGAYVEPAKMNLGEYLDRWQRNAVEHKAKGKTLERIASIVDKHLKPSLGSIPLSKLHPMHLQSYYTDALRSGRKDGKGGLAPRTVIKHHAVLHAALKQAVKWQLLPRNPADAVDLPKAEHTEMQVLDEQQTATLLQAAEGTWLFAPLMVAATTGLRRGELLALRWRDVDLRTGQVSIIQAVDESKKDGITLKEPKTKKSRRTVILPPMAIDVLRAHRTAQAQLRLLQGETYHDHDLVFPRDDGSVRRPSNFSKAFACLLEKTGLPKVRPHDLRHGHASHLLRAGVPVKVVSERLGHSTTAFTMDVYSHLLPGMQEDAALRIDTALRTAMNGQDKVPLPPAKTRRTSKRGPQR